MGQWTTLGLVVGVWALTCEVEFDDDVAAHMVSLGRPLLDLKWSLLVESGFDVCSANSSYCGEMTWQIAVPFATSGMAGHVASP